MTSLPANDLRDHGPETRTARSGRFADRPLPRLRRTRGGVHAAATALGLAALGLTGLVVTSSASATSPVASGGHHYGRSLFGTDGVAADDVWTVGLTPRDRA